MEYSKYQKAVFEEIEHGISNIVIEAAAGSAKTTTIIKALDFIPKDKKVLFIAFNNSIVEELKGKIGNRDNVDVCTMHSLGRSLLKQHGYPVALETNKYKTFLQNNSQIANMTLKLSEKNINKLIGNLQDLISLCRNFMTFKTREIKSVADRYDIQCNLGEIDIVKEALKWGKETVDCIDFDDMVWLPNALNLQPRYVQYDYIFLDEAQDANNAQIELFLRYRRNGTRMISVGDKDQSIYNFRGVDGSTFDKLKAMPNTITLSLPISYRCPKSVVEYAQKYSDNIEPWEEASEGEVNEDVSIDDIKENSLVLCRNNAPLVLLYLNLLNRHKKAYLSGNNKMFETIRDWALNSDFKNLEARCKKNGFIPQLWKMLFDKKDAWCSELNISEGQVYASSQFRELYDQIKSAETLCVGINTTKALLDRLTGIMNQDTDGIRLLTVHKAKGTESDNVYILCNSLMPSRFAFMDWEIEEERHIQYVAYTRSKKTLNFISEVEFGDFTAGKKEFVEKMEVFEREINKLTGREKHISPELSGIDKGFVDTIITSASTALQKRSAAGLPTRKPNAVSVATNINYTSKTRKRR